jgi:hypothetical protein
MDGTQEITPTAEWENTTDIRWILLPLLSAFGGAWIYRGTSNIFPSTELLTAMALILGGWTPLWYAVINTNWAHSLDRWQNWSEAEALPQWPYLQPGTAGSVLHRRLSQARVWWKKAGRPTLSKPMQQAFLALLVSLLLGFIIGRTALMLTLMTFACTQLAVLWSGGKREAGTGWLALTQAGLPWLLGSSLAQGIQTNAIVSGLVLIILVGVYALSSPFALVGPITAAVYLIWQEHTVTAGWLLLLALPGFIRLGEHPSTTVYRKAALPWILCMVGLMILVL